MSETAASTGRDGHDPSLRIHHDRDRDRYEARAGGAVVGVLAYGDEDPAQGTTGPAGPDHDRVVRDLRSTVVSPSHGGRGVGSALVRAAVEDARADGVHLRATCWFARGWIERHPEARDLLAPDPSATPAAPPAPAPTPEEPHP